jgi:hypothetical protein
MLAVKEEYDLIALLRGAAASLVIPWKSPISSPSEGRGKNGQSKIKKWTKKLILNY